ncbi:WXG100 family type VII secretion target [Nocardia vinacea]|uniref:WXG100 family type VII secretion target n=1 Tax=Nocardia vinacea TaxID=96468 RepID=UPI00341DF29E
MSGNEPTKIPPHGENVFRWERTEIEEAFKPLDPKNAHGAAMTYSNVATQWDQGLETFARSVQGSIAEAWEGSAADKAKDAINRYVTSAHELTPLITQMSDDMEAAADGVRNVANGIPEANHHSWTANVWPPRAHEEENTRNEATAGARNAMLTNYVNTFAAFDGSSAGTAHGTRSDQSTGYLRTDQIRRR